MSDVDLSADDGNLGTFEPHRDPCAKMVPRRGILYAAAFFAPGRAHAFFWSTDPEPPQPLEPAAPASNPDAWYIGETPDEPFNIPTVDLKLVPPGAA